MDQGDVGLLNDPVAQELLRAAIPLRLAHTWTDGTPRVAPIWILWTGNDIVVTTPPDAPKVNALRANPAVAVTIDGNAWPYHVLLVRGIARVEIIHGMVPEYALAAERYFGEAQGRA